MGIAWHPPASQSRVNMKAQIMAIAAMMPQIDQSAALSQGGASRSDKDGRGEDEADGE